MSPIIKTILITSESINIAIIPNIYTFLKTFGKTSKRLYICLNLCSLKALKLLVDYGCCFYVSLSDTSQIVTWSLILVL